MINIKTVILTQQNNPVAVLSTIKVLLSTKV